MKVRTSVKAGGMMTNRCETVARKNRKPSRGLKVATGVKAGGIHMNRCEAHRR